MTVVEGSSKAPFSIDTTPRYRGGRYSFPWIAPLYPWNVPYKQVPFSEFFVWLDLALKFSLLDHWRTLNHSANGPVRTTYSRFSFFYITSNTSYLILYKILPIDFISHIISFIYIISREIPFIYLIWYVAAFIFFINHV